MEKERISQGARGESDGRRARMEKGKKRGRRGKFIGKGKGSNARALFQCLCKPDHQKTRKSGTQVRVA